MRVVFDTNVLISALITKGTPPDMLYEKWSNGIIDVVTSRAQLKELSRVLSYKKLRKIISREEAQVLLEALNEQAQVIETLPKIKYSKDKEDNQILATAIVGKAELLITGDKSDLLSLNIVENVQIVTPRQALAAIEKLS